jgi:hypothetical protein
MRMVMVLHPDPKFSSKHFRRQTTLITSDGY